VLAKATVAVSIPLRLDPLPHDVERCGEASCFLERHGGEVDNEPPGTLVRIGREVFAD